MEDPYTLKLQYKNAIYIAQLLAHLPFEF